MAAKILLPDDKNLVRPDDLSTAQFLRAGVFGINGSGKSSLAASAARAGHRVLVASVGVENTKPYRGYGGRIYTRKVRTWDDLFPLIKMLDTGLNHPDVRSGDSQFFDFLVFDTWTRMQGSAAKKIAGWDPPADINALGKKLMQAPKTPRGFEAWQQIGELSNQWIGYFMDLPMHILWLFQEETRTPTTGQGERAIQTGPTKIGPMLTPSAIIGVRDSLEMLGRLYDPDIEPEDDPLGENSFGVIKREINPDRKEERRLLVGQHPLYLTKGPTHSLGYTVRNPTIKKLERALDAKPFRISERDDEPNAPATKEESE